MCGSCDLVGYLDGWTFKVYIDSIGKLFVYYVTTFEIQCVEKQTDKISFKWCLIKIILCNYYP